MSQYNEIKPIKTYVGKLEHGEDLLGQLTEIAKENNITLGKVEAIGAVQKANIGYYDQDTREYRFFDIDEHLEITLLTGNISIKDDKPMVHAHISLADEKGEVFGGHLGPGTIVFACEFVMTAYSGPKYLRTFDEQTGLNLWDL